MNKETAEGTPTSRLTTIWKPRVGLFVTCLVDLIRRATEKPKPRRPTKPTYSSKLKRLEGKAKRGTVKSGRGRVKFDD